MSQGPCVCSCLFSSNPNRDRNKPKVVSTIELATVRVRQDWLEAEIAKAGTLSAFADLIGIDVSNVSRQRSGRCEASPRFIGAVMVNFPITFDDAFHVTVEEATARRARIVKRPTGIRVA